MYTKVLIVDDELLARNQVRHMIQWEKEGFLICGEASDGMKAITLIHSTKPDIVLLDIDMPVMNGVSLCHYIHEHCKDIVMIILSNFDDFDYVRETLNLGAVDYLLKHRLQSIVLLEVLQSAEQRIVGKSSTPRPNRVNGLSTSNNLQLAKYSLHQLIESQVKIPQSNVTTEESSLKIPLDKNIIVLVLQIMQDVKDPTYQSDDHIRMFSDSIVGICYQLIGDTRQAYVDQIGKGRIAFVLTYPEYHSEAPVLQSSQLLIDKLKKSLQLIFNLKVVIGRSPICQLRRDIPNAYQHAQKQLMALVQPNHQNSNNQTESTITHPPVALTIRQEKDLLAAIMLKNITRINVIIDEVFDLSNSHKLDYSQTLLLIEELIHLAHRIGNKSGVNVKWLSEDMTAKRSQLGQLTEFNEWVKSIYSRLTNDIHKSKLNENYSDYIRQATALIKSKYQTGITLDEVASSIGISSPYLSKLFKQETGMSFTEYINRYRIDLSKQYLEDGNQKIKEMYHLFGFNTYNYFFKVFKEIAGETPQAYSKNHTNYGNKK